LNKNITTPAAFVEGKYFREVWVGGMVGGIPRWREAHFIRWTITLGIWGMEVL